MVVLLSEFECKLCSCSGLYYGRVISQGDNSVIAYEYVEDKEPFLFDVAPFACGSPHQV